MIMNMNKTIASCLLCCLAALTPTAPVEGGWLESVANVIIPPQKVEYPSIKVLVTRDQPAVILEVKGKYNIYDPRTGQLMSSRFKGKRRTLQATRQGIVWGEEFPGVHQMTIVPDDYSTKISIDGNDYFGSVYIYDVGGLISVVNQVLVEDYLDSLMTPMYREDMPQELLEALAITARTNAYYQSKNSKTPYWDVDAGIVGYKGATVTSSLSPIKRAIQQTQFLVLSQKGVNQWKSEPFAIQWGAYNIGKTPFDQPVYSKISIQEAVNMANRGLRANVILEKAFPQTSIELYQATSETAQNE